MLFFWLPSLLVTLLIVAAVPGGVVIEGKLASEAISGTTVPVDIRIHKGGLDYFGRLLIAAPEGCRLEADALFGGQFRWNEKDHVAVISWLKLPDAQQFDIRLNMKVAPSTAARTDALEWEFSFIRNNQRESVRPAPLHFNITSAASSGEAASSDAQAPQPISSAVASRSRNEGDGFWEAEVNVDGMPVGGFVKLEFPLPPRSSVEVLDPAGGTVSLQNHVLTFLWFDHQHQGGLLYRLTGCTLSEAQNSPGILSYVDGDESKEIAVIDLESQDLTPLGIDSASPDIHFEVQIAALKNHRVTDYFREQLEFRHEVKEERVAPWSKYTTGTFTLYEEARDHRNSLRSAYSIEGPFVIGREKGRRISVQEALTKTGQHWMP